MRMNVTRILAIVGFVALSVATSKIGAVKQRLAEKSPQLIQTSAGEVIENNMSILAQVGSEAAQDCGCEDEEDDCGCDCDLSLSSFHPCLHPHVKEIEPPKVCDAALTGSLGSTPATSTILNMESNQALSLGVSPDIRSTHEEESNSKSNEESTHESLSKGCKFRHFCIKGDIVVSEKVTFKEDSIEDDKSQGSAAMTTVSLDTIEAGEVLGGTPISYGLTSPAAPVVIASASSPVPASCLTDANCPTYYACQAGATALLPKVCVYVPDYFCLVSGSTVGKSCTILDLFNQDQVDGKCKKSSSTGPLVCAPLGCSNDGSCLHSSVLFCEKPLIPIIGQILGSLSCLVTGEF